MIASLLRRLTLPPAPDRSTAEGEALAALMVRLARADGAYAQTEQAAIDALLAARYGLEPAAAADLRRRGEALEARTGDTVHLTRAIKDEVAHDDRLALIEALWGVALADGARDHTEDGLMRLAVRLLGVSDVDSALARQRALKARNAGTQP